MRADDFDAFRFGKAKCAHCGHHPIMHMHPETIMDGIVRPCTGGNCEPETCKCMRYVPSAGDEPGIVLTKAPK